MVLSCYSKFMQSSGNSMYSSAFTAQVFMDRLVNSNFHYESDFIKVGLFL